MHSCHQRNRLSVGFATTARSAHMTMASGMHMTFDAHPTRCPNEESKRKSSTIPLSGALGADRQYDGGTNHRKCKENGEPEARLLKWSDSHRLRPQLYHAQRSTSASDAGMVILIIVTLCVKLQEGGRWSTASGTPSPPCPVQRNAKEPTVNAQMEQPPRAA